MIVVRLWHWAWRTPVIPVLDGEPGAMRRASFLEAVVGIY
jgi:hypothetical protein